MCGVILNLHTNAELDLDKTNQGTHWQTVTSVAIRHNSVSCSIIRFSTAPVKL